MIKKYIYIKLLELSGKQQWLMSLEKQRDMKELSLWARWKHIPWEGRTYSTEGATPAEGATIQSGRNPGSGLCDVTPWGWVDTEFWSVCAECLTQVHAHLSKSYLSKVGVWLAPPKPPPHSPVRRPNLWGICLPDSRQLVVCT